MRGRVRPSVGPSVPRYFRTLKLTVFEGTNSPNEGRTKDDEVVASAVFVSFPPPCFSSSKSFDFASLSPVSYIYFPPFTGLHLSSPHPLFSSSFSFSSLDSSIGKEILGIATVILLRRSFSRCTMLHSKVSHDGLTIAPSKRIHELPPDGNK